MRFVVAGSSGFLGTALRDRLARNGHEVQRLVRGTASAASESSWDPYTGTVDDDVIGAADVVINLGGVPIAHWPWTEDYKRQIRDSREATTGTLAGAVARTGGRAALINASGINAYGHPGDAVRDETSPRGDGFLAEVVRSWEDATSPAMKAGARVVMLRSGVVLHGSGGALALMKKPFLLGVGGRVGSGKQWFSWISLADWVSAVVFLSTSDVSGPVNLVAPQPVTNAEFTKAMGKVLRRPTRFPVPGLPMRLVGGEVASESLDSLRVVPTVLLAAGFSFEHPDIESALRYAFGR